MDDNKFDISIIIPTYNRAFMISSAIESCLAQEGCKKEIIIVDDGSMDNTLEVVRAFKSKFEDIKYFKTEHKGASNARNIGMKKANGEFIKFLDSDDILVKDILKEEIEIARAKNADMVYLNWVSCDIDEKGNEISNTEAIRYASDITTSLIDSIIRGRAIPTSAALYRRDYIEGIYWDVNLIRLQDWDWFVSVALKGGKCVYLDKISYYHREHSKSQLSDVDMFAYAKAHHYILDKFMKYMKLNNLLTKKRAQRMAQYYYKQLQVICECDKKMFREALDKIYSINPQFFPFEPRFYVRLLLKFFGLKNGLIIWVKIKLFLGKIFYRLKGEKNEK